MENQTDFANKSGLSSSFLSKLESTGRLNRNRSTRKLLAAALDVSVAELEARAAGRSVPKAPPTQAPATETASERLDRIAHELYELAMAIKEKGAEFDGVIRFSPRARVTEPGIVAKPEPSRAR